jgi:hypothetical protein
VRCWAKIGLVAFFPISIFACNSGQAFVNAKNETARMVPLATTRREDRPKAPPSVTTLSGVAALLRAK